MTQYAVHWTSKLTNKSGHGKAMFTKERGEQVVANLTNSTEAFSGKNFQYWLESETNA